MRTNHQIAYIVCSLVTFLIMVGTLTGDVHEHLPMKPLNEMVVALLMGIISFMSFIAGVVNHSEPVKSNR